MIEAKLTESGRDPLRTQVLLHDVEGGVCIGLRDESGVFHEVPPPELRDLPRLEGKRSQSQSPKQLPPYKRRLLSSGLSWRNRRPR